MKNNELPACPVETTLTLIGNKWKVLILRDLMPGSKRFGKLQRSIGKISQKVLTSNLKEMETKGIVHRKVYAEVPPRVEYSLTDLVKSLKPILDSMWNWGENYKSAASEISIQLDKKYGTIKVYDITKGINATKIYTDTDVVPLSVKDYAFILEFNENSESVNIEKNNIEQLHYFNQASELHLIGNASIRTLSIYNIGGTRVLYQEFPENIVSLANLPKGSYIIQTTNINGKKKVKKIVK